MKKKVLYKINLGCLKWLLNSKVCFIFVINCKLKVNHCIRCLNLKKIATSQTYIPQMLLKSLKDLVRWKFCFWYFYDACSCGIFLIMKGNKLRKLRLKFLSVYLFKLNQEQTKVIITENVMFAFFFSFLISVNLLQQDNLIWKRVHFILKGICMCCC